MSASIIHITCGLPGAGKTEWSRQYQKQTKNYQYRVHIVHLDDLVIQKRNQEYIVDQICLDARSSNETIIDGLFLDTASIINILSQVKTCDKKKKTALKDLQKVIIHYWTPDVQACLKNDQERRSKDSKITIENAKLEEPKISEIKGVFGEEIRGVKIELQIHTTKVKPEWKTFAKQYDLTPDDQGNVKSGAWCLGGTWGSYTGSKGEVSAEPTPVAFQEFDSLLEKICPSITFLQYKLIYNQLVSTEETDQGDYYGGRTNYACYLFNVEKLYNALRERDLI